jgi:hypothetical protein
MREKGRRLMVGAEGFEPPTLCSQSPEGCPSTKLRNTMFRSLKATIAVVYAICPQSAEYRLLPSDTGLFPRTFSRTLAPKRTSNEASKTLPCASGDTR